jgi:hypothetical protein
MGAFICCDDDRRGTLLENSLTSAILRGSWLVGFDDSGLLLNYISLMCVYYDKKN